MFCSTENEVGLEKHLRKRYIDEPDEPYTSDCSENSDGLDDTNAQSDLPNCDDIIGQQALLPSVK